MLCNRKSHLNERPMHSNRRIVPALRNKRKVSSEDPAQPKINKHIFQKDRVEGMGRGVAGRMSSLEFSERRVLITYQPRPAWAS